MRVLHIPCPRDRAAQRAVLHVIAPLCEVMFLHGSHGFRQGRGVQSALRHLRAIRPNRPHVLLKVDIASLFDTLTPAHVAAGAAQIGDPLWRALVAQWCRWSPAVPQGAPLSPLLANLVLHQVLDLPLRSRERRRWLRYADDLVVVCPDRPSALATLAWIQGLLNARGLALNAKKSRIGDAWRPLRVLGRVQPMLPSPSTSWTSPAAPWWQRAATPEWFGGARGIKR